MDVARRLASIKPSDSHTVLAHSAGASDVRLCARPAVIARVAGCWLSLIRLTLRGPARLFLPSWRLSILSNMTIDLGETYRTTRLRVADLVDDSVADRAVPATPAWTAHDVVAHLAGVLNDVATGNLEGAATDPWTAAQVERGRDRPISQLVDDWAAAAPGFETFLSSPAGVNASAALMDVSCHETDLRAALGLAPALSDEM